MTKRVPMQHKTYLPATIAEAIVIDEEVKRQRDADYREYLEDKERFQREQGSEEERSDNE